MKDYLDEVFLRINNYFKTHFPPESRILQVYVCTSAKQFGVQAFIDEFKVRFYDLVETVQYYELPDNDIDKFSFKGKDIDIMLLCHSINDRRFAITDVQDAIYDKFLRNAAKTLGS